MREVCVFRLGGCEERQAAVTGAANVGKGIEQRRAGVLAHGTQFGEGGSPRSLQLDEGYRLPNVWGDLEAGHAARYHFCGIEAVVNGVSQYQIDLGSLSLQQPHIVSKVGV